MLLPPSATEGSRASVPPSTLRSALSLLERRILLAVIYLEIAVNVINGCISLVFPTTSLEPLSRVAVPVLAGEVARWFGAVTMAFGGWLLFRSLSSPAALRLVLEALLVGDVLYLGALIPFTVSYGQVPMIVAPYALTLVMFAARMYWLLREDWPAAIAAAAAAPLP